MLNKVKRKFLEEADALRSMSHPNIVKVFDSFEENGTAYYVMKYIDGLSLHDMVKNNGPIPEDKAVKYIKQVAKALEYVHGRNRLHLDIKPGNIMIDQNNNAILIDLGVSKHYDEANGESTSTILGKAPGYSPIEQLGNNIQSFTPATDIYALGATLYKCVTGNTPPDATTVLTDGLPALSARLKQTTRKAIRESMKPRSNDRPQTIVSFLDCFKKPERPEPPIPDPTPIGGTSGNEDDRFFEVILTKIGWRDQSVINLVQELTGVSSYIAKNVPFLIKTKLTKTEAEELKKRFEDLGASVVLKKDGVPYYCTERSEETIIDPKPKPYKQDSWLKKIISWLKKIIKGCFMVLLCFLLFCVVSIVQYFGKYLKF